LIGYYQLFGWGNHHHHTSYNIRQAKTKGAQYAQIIEEDDEARVKLLYDKTKGAQYAPIIE
jgi:hypothetical protein